MNPAYYARKNMAWVMSVLFAITILVSACAPVSGAKSEVAMAPLADMPPEVQSAPVSVSEAYRFAVANPEVMENLPCYCGCGSIGHSSNYACYVQSDEAGEVVFDTHALGCGICVDITRDAMRMIGKGMPLADIRAAIDQDYSQFGPSNMP